MKLFKKAKKGFTLIELVVVIAVIAILSTIAIISFISVTNKAKESHDNQIIDQVNLSLKADEALNGKPKTMHRALEALKEDGFLPANFGDLRGTAKDYTFAYSLKENKFVALKGGKISYPSGVGEHANHELWKIAESTTGLDDGYSYYLRGEDKTGPVSVKAGFDAGDNTGITEINYSNPSGNHNSVIRTNGGKLTVNAKKDTVSHYGSADSVVIKDVDSESYHENGEVKFLEVSAGHIVLEKDAEVTAFHFSATNGQFKNEENKTISVDLSNVSNEKMPEFSRDAVEIADNGTYVAEVKTDSTEYIWLFGSGIKEQMVVTTSEGAIASNGELNSGLSTGAEDGSVAEQIANPAKRNDAGELLDADDNVINLNNVDLSDASALDNVAVVEEVAPKADVQTGATLFAGGSGTQIKPYLISNPEQWNNFYQMVYDSNKDNKTPYFELANDINLAGFEIHNYAVSNNENIYDHDMNFVIDGKGYSVLKIETLKGYKQVFPYIDNSVIKNITIDYNLVNSTKTCAMSYNCFGKCLFENVITTGTISTSADWASSFVVWPFDTNGGRVTYKNCISFTNLSANFTSDAYVAPFGSHTMSITNVILENCKNYGTVAGGHASAFIGMTGGNSSRYTISNLENYGKVIYSEDNGGGLFTFGNHSLNNNVVAKETSSVERLPAITLEINENNKLVIKNTNSTFEYRVTMSVSTQLYGFNGNNTWSGAFPRSLTKTYSNISGDYTTDFEEAVVLEKAGNRLNYEGNAQNYYGIFAPTGAENATIKLANDNEYISLRSYNGKTFYYYDESNSNGTNSHGLVTTTNGAETGQFSGTITVTLNVEQLLNGTTTSSGKLTYTFNVADAAAFFND